MSVWHPSSSGHIRNSGAWRHRCFPSSNQSNLICGCIAWQAYRLGIPYWTSSTKYSQLTLPQSRLWTCLMPILVFCIRSCWLPLAAACAQWFGSAMPMTRRSWVLHALSKVSFPGRVLSCSRFSSSTLDWAGYGNARQIATCVGRLGSELLC